MKQTVSNNNFPGGSKKRVNRAGDNIRNHTATVEDYLVVEEWRSAHRGVLNTFQAILRNRTRGGMVTVAQRHKRRRTIFNKLHRFPGMQLSRMDDVAGCRLIFQSISALRKFRDNFHYANFDHQLRNEPDKYDYIKNPKNTGYRGIHDVYVYNVRSETGKSLAGLNLEIQYRTKVQHAWATAVEVVGFITESQPKFQQGDIRYQHAMALASEVLSRSYEDMSGCFHSLKDRDLVQQFKAADKDLNLMKTLRGLNAANQSLSNKRNSILIFSPTGELEVKSYRDSTEALKALFLLEKQQPDRDIVLVRADSGEEVRFAFKNYFSDARDFIKMVEDGCHKLHGRNR